ncbi:FAD-dependent oxidoreductase [Variovorax sp. Sphag1AA]|uniref:NAD(P)/FAD-dependent oxidoreductase n=1 Tax=Variovorax sp. Sphag1AA TaxID=2587027 RepID=UPI001612BFFF|nr:FAD-dependent oxidoreductase [Variovorax sp. Sphag1AA]MBB3177985.1 3-phenylpropionate/trans-cinnamate dioxygenase ferredoxin reductase subunit [Variovorax sp. Sphag1AA]
MTAPDISIQPIVVVGAGQAACQFIASLRQMGHQGPVVVLGDEPQPPYQRPPLSKAFLHAGDETSLLLRPLSFFETMRCDLRLGVKVMRILPEKSEVELENGEHLRYAQLVLATGARARDLPGLGGGDQSRVFVLRSLAHARALREGLAHCRRLAVIGGGYVGLEVAASARTQGVAVTVFESAARVMQRSVGEVTSSLVQEVHADHDVQLRLGVSLQKVHAAADGIRLGVAGEAEQHFDALLVGIGAEPCISLAKDAGIACAKGILVDDQGRTSAPGVLAIGDCTEARDGGRPRLESVQGAIDQAKVAAAALAGRPVPSPTVPWFWSDQYSHRLQVAGIARDHDTEVLRRHGPKKQSVWYLRAGRVIAVEAFDAAEDFMAARMLIRSGAQLQMDQLADPSYGLGPAPSASAAAEMASG